MINCIPTALSAASGIYQITCISDGRIYVGSTINFASRFSQHNSSLIKQKAVNQRLQLAYNEYGGDSFVFSVLCIIARLKGETLSEFSVRIRHIEQDHIDMLSSKGEQIGFNINSSTRTVRQRGNTMNFHKKKKADNPQIDRRFGSHSHLSTIDEDQAKTIKIYLAKGIGCSTISNVLNINRAIISHIARNKSWKRVAVTPSEINSIDTSHLLDRERELFNKSSPRKSTRNNMCSTVRDIADDILIKKIKYLLSVGHSTYPIARFLNTSVNLVKGVKYRNTNNGVVLSEADINDFVEIALLEEFEQFLVNDAELIKARRMTSQVRGAKVGTSTLSDSIVISIKNDLRAGVTVKELAGKLGLAQNTIRNIGLGKRWSHI